MHNVSAWLNLRKFRNEVLLRDIIEARMKGKAYRGKRKLHMLRWKVTSRRGTS